MQNVFLVASLTLVQGRRQAVLRAYCSQSGAKPDAEHFMPQELCTWAAPVETQETCCWSAVPGSGCARTSWLLKLRRLSWRPRFACLWKVNVLLLTITLFSYQCHPVSFVKEKCRIEEVLFESPITPCPGWFNNCLQIMRSSKFWLSLAASTGYP